MPIAMKHWKNLTPCWNGRLPHAWALGSLRVAVRRPAADPAAREVRRVRVGVAGCAGTPEGTRRANWHGGARRRPRRRQRPNLRLSWARPVDLRRFRVRRISSAVHLRHTRECVGRRRSPQAGLRGRGPRIATRGAESIDTWISMRYGVAARASFASGCALRRRRSSASRFSKRSSCRGSTSAMCILLSRTRSMCWPRPEARVGDIAKSTGLSQRRLIEVFTATSA